METKVLSAKGGSTRAFKDIILQVIEATKDGWEPHDDFNNVMDCRIIGSTHFYVKMQRGEPRAGVMIEENQQPTISEPEGDLTSIEDVDNWAVNYDGQGLVKQQAEAMAERVAQINAAKTKKALDELATRFLYNIEDADKKPLGKYRRVLLEKATATS